jgi:hypothetical protein
LIHTQLQREIKAAGAHEKLALRLAEANAKCMELLKENVGLRAKVNTLGRASDS